MRSPLHEPILVALCTFWAAASCEHMQTHFHLYAPVVFPSPLLYIAIIQISAKMQKYKTVCMTFLFM